jgi:hypothetical protein
MSNGRWRAAVNGPDWTDVRATMGALGELHSCTCYLELAPDGSGPGVGLVIRALLVSNTPGSDLKAAELGISREWPNRESASMEQTAYRLLYELDHLATQKWWENGKLQLP